MVCDIIQCICVQKCKSLKGHFISVGRMAGKVFIYHKALLCSLQSNSDSYLRLNRYWAPAYWLLSIQQTSLEQYLPVAACFVWSVISDWSLMCLNISLLSFGQTYLGRHSISWQGWRMHLRFLGSKRVIFHPAASANFERVKTEQVSEKVLSIKDYFVRWKDRESLCLISRGLNLFHMPLDFPNGASKPHDWFVS